MTPTCTAIYSADGCRALLRPGGIGRVAASVSAFPGIFPIRYAMLDDDIVLRISPEGLPRAALAGAVVAFEVDAVDSSLTHVWSVLVVGRSHVITDRDALAAAGQLSLASWGKARHDVFSRISDGRISGRAYDSAHVLAGIPPPPNRGCAP